MKFIEWSRKGCDHYGAVGLLNQVFHIRPEHKWDSEGEQFDAMRGCDKLYFLWTTLPDGMFGLRTRESHTLQECASIAEDCLANWKMKYGKYFQP